MILGENLRRDVAYLTEKIGIRLAGSQEERQAAEYLQKRFLEFVPKCVIEEFDTTCRCVEKEQLQVLADGVWKDVPALLFNGAPGTDGKTVEAELAYFDPHSDYDRPDLSDLQGKAVIHWGLNFGSGENYSRMMQAKPAFLIMVDTRYTSDVPLGDGLYPAYVKAHGAVPSVNVAFYDAWKLCTEKVRKVRLNVMGTAVPAKSHNVIAELPGTLEEPMYFYCGAHLDTQAGSVGADDNAIGCAVLVELARVLSQKKLRHTIRLIAFGAEEQLSVGSAAYVRRHRDRIETRGQFMWNFDSCASAVGWNRFLINAEDALTEQLQKSFHENGVYYQQVRTAEPCIDLFPFTAAGVPGISMCRRNCETGTFFHHRPTNALPAISVKIAAQIAEAAAEQILTLDTYDGAFAIDPTLKKDVAAGWEETFGGWEE